MTRRSVLLKALASMPSDVGRVLNGIDSTAARHQPGSRERSLVDVLLGWLDFETRYRAQLWRVVREERPTVYALRSDQANLELDVPLTELIDRLQTARQETLTFLEGLSPGDWQRKAVHETEGDTSLRFLVQSLVDYDTHRLSRLVEVRQGFGTVSLTAPGPVLSNQSMNPISDSEERDGRRRTRKWPRKRSRRRN